MSAEQTQKQVFQYIPKANFDVCVKQRQKRSGKPKEKMDGSDENYVSTSVTTNKVLICPWNEKNTVGSVVCGIQQHDGISMLNAYDVQLKTSVKRSS